MTSETKVNSICKAGQAATTLTGDGQADKATVTLKERAMRDNIKNDQKRHLVVFFVLLMYIKKEMMING